MTLLVVGIFALTASIGMPLAFALGFASLAVLLYADFELVVMPQRMMYAIDNFPLMAIPLFMLAGELMDKAGIMERLISFSNALVGRVHGGLAHVTIIAGALLSTVSGASVASATALGSTLVPALRSHYSAGYATAIVASSANLGPIIPPSSAMIVYALMAGSTVSVGGLFIAGIVPGFILTVAFMALASWIAWRRGYPHTGEAFNIRNALHQLRRAMIIIMMPIIVMGGIIGGAFTATEGAAIACAYAAVVGFLVTRTLKLSHLPECLFRAAVTSAMVGALMAFAAAVTFVFTVDLVPQQLSEWIRSLTANPAMFILLVMAMLVVVGMFLESNAAYIMLVPLFAPIAAEYGIDPLYFGSLFVLNLVIGMMTPPVGVLLFVMAGITKLPMTTIIRECLPYVYVQFAVLALCAIFPSLILWLPRLLGY